MTATAISTDEWVQAVLLEAHRLDDEIGEALDRALEAVDLHPQGEEAVHGWRMRMRDAGCVGDVREMHRLFGLCRERIAQEREWARETGMY